MGYGSRARRVPALGGASLTDVDIYKVLLLGKTERGIVDSDGYPVVHNEIYSMNDFYPKAGGFNSSYYAAYVAKTFFDELDTDNVSCEMSLLSFVDSSAAQASYSILDGALSPVQIFNFLAGRRGLVDKSAFGNKIGIKVTQVEELSLKLTGDLAESATSGVFNNVDGLRVGYYIKFTEGASTEVKVITGITPSTKTVTFSAITDSGGFSAAGTTITRIDWKLNIAVKDDAGNYQEKEEWEGPMAQSNTIGLASDVNDETTGSEYGYLEVNSSNTSDPEDQIPAALTDWTALTGGSDGSAPTDSDWNTLAETYLGSVEFTILLAPESSSVTHNGNMLDFCTDGYKGMYYAQSSNGATKAILQNLGATLRGSVKFGMLPSDKWIKTDDPTVIAGKIDIPKVGVDAAHWFNVYSQYGESKVAAGNKQEMRLKTSDVLLDSNGLVHDDRNNEGARLIRDYSINICRYRRGIGITNNSARTFSIDDGYKYQNQIMAFLLYSRSVVAYLRTIEQDRAGRDAQTTHYNEVWSYMKGKYNAGHLFVGQKEDGSLTEFSDVCIIKNDFTINTLADINDGIEVIFLQFVAPVPIEEAILSLASAGVTTVKA